MKISKKDQKMLLVLLGLLIFFAAYFGICKSYNAKKEDVKTQITELQVQSAQLQAYASNEGSYRSEIDKISSNINSELAKYPSDVRSEDLVMYVTKLEDTLGITVGSLSIASPEVVSQFSLPKASGNSYEIDQISVVKTALTIKCGLSYAQFKKLIDSIYASSNKTDLASASLSYDQETGGLSGTIIIDKYFIASADYTYTPTNIPPVEKGVNDPFGTGAVPEDTADTENAAGGTGAAEAAGAANAAGAAGTAAN